METFFIRHLTGPNVLNENVIGRRVRGSAGPTQFYLHRRFIGVIRHTMNKVGHHVIHCIMAIVSLKESVGKN